METYWQFFLFSQHPLILGKLWNLLILDQVVYRINGQTKAAFSPQELSPRTRNFPSFPPQGPGSKWSSVVVVLTPQSPWLGVVLSESAGTLGWGLQHFISATNSKNLLSQTSFSFNLLRHISMEEKAKDRWAADKPYCCYSVAQIMMPPKKVLFHSRASDCSANADNNRLKEPFRSLKSSSWDFWWFWVEMQLN